MWEFLKNRNSIIIAGLVASVSNWGCGKSPGKFIENLIDCGRDTCDSSGNGDKPAAPDNEYPQFNLTMEPFADCADLQQKSYLRLNAAKIRNQAWTDYYSKVDRFRNGTASKVANSRADSESSEDSKSRADSAAPTSNASESDEGEQGQSGSTPADNITNIQEKNIDEPDFVKAGTKSLFVARGNRVEVVDRVTLALRGTIHLGANLQRGENLFIVNDKLVAITESSAAYNSATLSVKIFAKDTGGATSPTLERELAFNGTFKDARLNNGHIVLVVEDSMPIASRSSSHIDQPIPQNPVTITDDARVANVPCGKIIQPQILDEDWRLTKVFSINVVDPTSSPHATALLGAGDKIYMGQDSLYVGKQGMQWSWGHQDENRSSFSKSHETLVITRIKFDKNTGALTPIAIGAVRGRAKDQWSFKEFPDHGGTLAVATSTGRLWSNDRENKAQNHLYFLTVENSSLKQLSSLHDFGTGEDIRSVRYIDRTAYVVTFKNTDPLFAFDLTDLANPRQLGELKIPGFSTYMHPAGPGRLLGVGFDTEDQGSFARIAGVKVSLFNTEDPRNLSQLDAKIIGDRGTSSDATGNHHGFFFDAKNSLVALPVVEVRAVNIRNDGYGDKASFAGAIIYKLNGSSIIEIARLTHNDLTPDRCRGHTDYSWWESKFKSYDINRIYNIDDRLITVSRFGIKAHSLVALANAPHLAQSTGSTKFDPLSDSKLNDLGICRKYSRWED